MAEKALIIGAAGFVGNYLIDHIQENCMWSVVATKMPYERIEKENADIRDLDILDKEAVMNLLRNIRPDYIFHLAAQSSVSLAWKNPDLTVDVNIKGCFHVLDAARTLDYRPRILLVGSGEEYGAVRPEEIPVREENALRPGNIYAITKACQNMAGELYSKAYCMDIMTVRAFNHAGPKQASMFVVSDFCRQVAEIERGLREPVIWVGNLSAKRDFSDVRDVVRAYTLLMERGRSGETYNVGSGKAIAIQEILDTVLSQANQPIRVETDAAKLRPVDVPIIAADIRKLMECTGWERRIFMEQTILDTLEYWRRHL